MSAITPDDTHRRASDHGALSSLAAMWTRYQVVVALAVLLATAAGFGWQTPAHSFKALELQLTSSDRVNEMRDTLIATRVRALEAESRDTRAALRILVRIECRRDRSNAELAGAECPASRTLAEAP